MENMDWELSKDELKLELTEREKAALENWKLPTEELTPEMTDWNLPNVEFNPTN